MQKIIAVCGRKNSGKTTLISKLVTYYSEQGKKVAVIKHDGHDFSCDIPGTDSYRIKDAGAYGVGVFSEHRIFVHKTDIRENENALINIFPEADLIFLEGFKYSAYHKIEVVRREIADTTVSNPEGRFLIATDLPIDYFKENTVHMNDIAGIATFIDNLKL